MSATDRSFWVRTIGKAVRNADGRIVRIQGALQAWHQDGLQIHVAVNDCRWTLQANRRRLFGGLIRTGSCCKPQN